MLHRLSSGPLTRVSRAAWLAALVLVPASAAAADLKSSVTVKVVDTTATFTAKICNNTATPASGASLLLFYNLASAPTCSTACTAGSCQSFANLAVPASGCLTLTGTKTWAIGAYTAWTRACGVTDSAPADDVGSADYVVRPDLVVSAFSAAAVGTTNDIAYTITVKNVGPGMAAAQQLTLGLYYDRPAAPATTDVPDQTFTFSGLAYNATFSKSFTRYGAPTKKYSSWVLVDRAATVSEADETNNTKQAVVAVGTNVVIDSVAATAAGTSVDFALKVCNKGNLNSGSFKVSLWYDRAAAPACGATGESYSSIVAGLAPTSCTTLNHTRIAVPGGSFTAWAFADPTCTTAESDETDNVKSKAYAMGKPDLKLDSFSAQVSGSNVTYKAKVCNLGATTGLAFKVGLVQNANSAPGCAAAMSFVWPDIMGLAAGQCTAELSHTATVSGAGTFTAYAVADPGCLIAESLETNNSRSASYAVAPDKPDLYVSAFKAAVTGNSVEYRATVCNGGLATTTTFQVGIYFNATAATGNPNATVAVAGLAGGACKAVSHTRVVAPGSYTAWVKADSGTAVTELDENNNTDSDPYTIASPNKPDLTVTELVVTTQGSNVTYAATVKNSGTAAADQFTLGLFHDRSSAPACGVSPDASEVISSLAVGAEVTKTWTRSAVTAGSYTAWAMADTGCGVTESDEANNGTSKAYTIGGSGSDAGVADSGPKKDTGAWDTQPAKKDGGSASTPPGGGCSLEGSPAAGPGPLLALLLGLAVLGRTRRRD